MILTMLVRHVHNICNTIHIKFRTLCTPRDDKGDNRMGAEGGAKRRFKMRYGRCKIFEV